MVYQLKDLSFCIIFIEKEPMESCTNEVYNSKMNNTT